MSWHATPLVRAAPLDDDRNSLAAAHTGGDGADSDGPPKEIVLGGGTGRVRGNRPAPCRDRQRPTFLTGVARWGYW